MGLDAHVFRRGVNSDEGDILSDCFLAKHLGNIAAIAFLREKISELPQADFLFPMILRRVIYSGTHSGDEIEVCDVPYLKAELERLTKMALEEDIHMFIRGMNELCDASLLTENPIVF
jgi:hypothetical protein